MFTMHLIHLVVFILGTWIVIRYVPKTEVDRPPEIYLNQELPMTVTWISKRIIT